MTSALFRRGYLLVVWYPSKRCDGVWDRTSTASAAGRCMALLMHRLQCVVWDTPVCVPGLPALVQRSDSESLLFLEKND